MNATTECVRTWIRHGVFAHNLTKIATLTARQLQRETLTQPSTPAESDPIRRSRRIRVLQVE